MPLLLVHGELVSGEMFEPIVGHLSKLYRVIIPDLRGHGRSRDMPPPYTPAHLASDLSSLLDHLGVTSAAILGYSQGGAIAQQLVLDYPTRCRRLVLVCTYAYNMATFKEKLEGFVTTLLIRVLDPKVFAKLVVSLGAKKLSKETADRIINLIAANDKKRVILFWKELLAFDSRKRLSEIRCPTLIIAGAKDGGVPIHHARMLHDRIADSQLVVIENADHTLIWTFPEELVRALDKFLQS